MEGSANARVVDLHGEGSADEVVMYPTVNNFSRGDVHMSMSKLLNGRFFFESQLVYHLLTSRVCADCGCYRKVRGG